MELKEFICNILQTASENDKQILAKPTRGISAVNQCH